MKPARYTAHVGDGIIIVRDDGPHDSYATITNDAERVVFNLCRSHGLLPIVYQDSNGRWDQLAHEAGVFTGFVMLGGATAREAAERLRVRERVDKIPGIGRGFPVI